MEVDFRARLAGVIDKRERAADRLGAPHDDVHELRSRARPAVL